MINDGSGAGPFLSAMPDLKFMRCIQNAWHSESESFNMKIHIQKGAWA
ncbi:hypothetical protein [Limnohabitans sp. T6-5]|nr:hypothetical protein [Limnohabitans sp. T6-5]